MKTAIFAIVSFTIPFAGTTFWLVSNAPPPPPAQNLVADSIALADSLLADSLWRDSVVLADHTPSHAPGDSGQAEAQVSLPVDVASQAMVAEPPGPAAQTSTTPDDAARQAAYRSLARVFGQMKPADAAQVIMHMNDDEVERVLRNLGARQTAAVLSNLPERRAAALARRLMVPQSGSHQ